jgi:predicted transcriptional regulator
MNIQVLTHMLENAERIAPWKIEDFNRLGVPASTLYRQLKSLRKTGLVVKVSGGYVLSSLILDSGTKQKSAFMRIDITKNQESIHGKA